VWARYLRMIMLSLLVVGRCQLGLRPGLVCEVSDLEVKGMSDQFIFFIFLKNIFLEIVEWTLVVFLSLLFKKIFIHIHTHLCLHVYCGISFLSSIFISLSLFFCLSMPICLLAFFFFVYGICGRLNRNMKRCSRPARRCNTIYRKK